MSKKLTSKQQAFVDAYLSNGQNGAGAYHAAYNPKASAILAATEGYKLLRLPHIRHIADTWKAKQSAVTEERIGLTREILIQRIDELHIKAVAREHYAGARGLGDLLARLNGWVIERRDIRMIRSVKDLADEELAAIAAEGE